MKPYLFIEENKGGMNTLHPLKLEINIDKPSSKAALIPKLQRLAELPIRHLYHHSDSTKGLSIVGTGPTIKEYMDELKSNTNTICTINRSHEYLIKREIIPDMHILYESDIIDITNSLGGKPHKKVTYYVCSVCPDKVFKQLKGYKVVLWHTDLHNDEYYEFMKPLFPNEPFIDVGSLTHLKALGIGHVMGYRKFDLYGIDCSFPFAGNDHIDKNVEYEPKLYICARNSSNEYRRYYTNLTLMQGIIEFMDYYAHNKDLEIKIYGEGLLGFVSK